MANHDNPHGFTKISGRAPVWYQKDATSSALLVVGDPVKVETDGYVVRAAAGGVFRGVIEALKSTTGKVVNQLGAAVAGNVSVCDDPDATYKAQDNAGGTCNQACVGTNADFIVANGDTLTGKSACEIDGSTYANTAAQVRIVELWKGIDGNTINAVGNHCEWVVTPNESDLKSTTGI